jgi:hypothetical protein
MGFSFLMINFSRGKAKLSALAEAQRSQRFTFRDGDFLSARRLCEKKFHALIYFGARPVFFATSATAAATDAATLRSKMLGMI